MSNTENKYFAPPWMKYPNCPSESLFWKNGSGAEYLLEYEKLDIEDEEYLNLFPKPLVYTDDVKADDSLSDEAHEYLDYEFKPLFVKLWTPDAKPKYSPEYVEDEYIFMYDTLYDDKSNVVQIGVKHYHSLAQLVTFAQMLLSDISSSLWDELKYTVYLNSIYYFFVSDINFVNEILHTGDKVIVYKSDNLELGMNKNDDGNLVGENLMGIAMMQARDEIKRVYANYDLIDWELSGGANSVERCMCNHH
ncbi:MAG: hypothetical protein BZ136_01300 [Methanosphaera sp. rholeuAM74]|nr:MAG: hypothetical protein BZ136_01300 [Methanosphaera sp. rholeuAM74]